MAKFLPPSRYAVFILCFVVMLIAFGVGLMGEKKGLFVGVPFAALVLVGLWDLGQPRHSIRRNYPVTGHIRWWVEMVRPEIRQYLIEADEEAAPFSRDQRALVYDRAKGNAGEHPFGTLLDAYRDGFEFIGHSTMPVAPPPDPASFRITIGGPDCTAPYSASVFNISAMSFGAISANAIR